MRAFRWIASAVLVGVMASGALAARGIVTTNNGQTFEGEIVEEVNSVTVIRQGIRTRIARDEIQTLRFVGEPSEEIKKEWSKLRRDDVPGRIKLARQAFQIRNYELTRALAQEAVIIDPNSADGAELLELVRRQIALEERAAKAVQAQRSQPSIGGAAGADLAVPIKLMDERDMNALRQAELQDGDSNFVRVRFANDVRRRFASLPQTDAREFAQLSAFQQAVTIIREGTKEMREDVLLTGDPYAIRSFRTVQRSILNGCATAQCHGSLAGGNFILYPLQETDQVTYTNFYLLMKYARINREAPETIFGGSGARVRMIDRQRPNQSLLLQYGLTPSLAETPHPNVPGLRAAFGNVNEAVYGRVFNWIHDALRPVDVRYEINYVSPVEVLSQPGDGSLDIDPTTAPASRPSTRPTAATKPATATVPTPTSPASRAAPGSVPMPLRPGEMPASSRPTIPMPKR